MSDDDDIIKWDEMNTVGKFEKGSRKWWCGEARYAIGGLYDCILRLFEQGSITRSKARELLTHADRPRSTEHPSAPWGELRWDGDVYASQEEKITAARDLLARIHRDDGSHTEEVGFVQSCEDAEYEWLGLMDALSDLVSDVDKFLAERRGRAAEEDRAVAKRALDAMKGSVG